MDAVFVKLVNMRIAASWLILAVMLLRLALRKAPKWVNVLLWGLVALRLLCPFSIKSALSLIPGSETVPEEIFFYEAAQQHTPAWLDIADNPAFSQNVSLATEQSVSTVQTHFLLWTLLWLAGMTAMLLYAAISYARLRRRVSESIPLRENIYLCDRVQTPFILGVLRPRVYLPSDLNEEQVQSVIAHERAHLARRDHWWKLLGWLLLAVYWFNPLCWAAHILFCRDIEMACDEKVIRDMDVAGRKTYSEALLSCSLPKRSVAACPLAFGEVGVKQRIKGVLNYKKPAFWLVALAVLVCAAAAVCFLTDPMEKPEGADTPYEYPVRPGMDAWAQYQSLEEQIEACQVPEELLSAMTTEALVETVADYPLLVNILAYSNPGDGDAGIIRGAGDVMGYCNALKELSRRPDALPAVQVKQAELEQDESPEAAVKATCFRAIAGLFEQLASGGDESALFASMPSIFHFLSGAGGWQTELYWKGDGSFSGVFEDADAGSLERCEFTGTVGALTKVNDLEYSTRVTDLNYDEPGETAAENGISVTTAEPYGLNDADELRIYLPGYPVNRLPSAALDWIRSAEEFWDGKSPSILPFYVLYNVNGEQAFFSADWSAFTE